MDYDVNLMMVFLIYIIKIINIIKIIELDRSPPATLIGGDELSILVYG